MTAYESYYTIEVAASQAGLTTRRVRSLLRLGLVRPAAMDRRRPLFSEAELARLRKIRRLSEDLGVNLPGVEIILRLTDDR